MKLASDYELEQIEKEFDHWFSGAIKEVFSNSRYSTKYSVMEFIANKKGLTTYRSLAKE